MANIMGLLRLLPCTIVILALIGCPMILADQPAASSSSPATGSMMGMIPVSSLPSTPSPNSDDEANGDDGAAIKKDLEQMEKSQKTENNNHNYQFYEPEYITDPKRAMSYWLDFSKFLSQNMSTKHEMLSKSHRRAAPVKLSFDFPFYGQPLRNIIIATGGFLYVGEHLHHWLAATQNISPLMANFDLSLNNYSDIHHYDNGTSFTVQWLNVQMMKEIPPGNFSFQVTLFKNGDIVFVYDSLPVPVNKIPEEEHPVKVGISDAFLIDRLAFFVRRKTIYDYHRLNMKEFKEIGNHTAIYLKALPTCNQYDSCEKCAGASSAMECHWCDAVKRCSNGYDRKRQEWLTNTCDKIERTICTKPDSNTPTVPTTSPAYLNPIGTLDSSSSGAINSMLTVDKQLPDPRSSEGGAAFLTLFMVIALTSGVALWAFYAYKNPHTPSGQLLIKYRPSNWRWQDAETRYTAASIHM